MKAYFESLDFWFWNMASASDITQRFCAFGAAVILIVGVDAVIIKKLRWQSLCIVLCNLAGMLLMGSGRIVLDVSALENRQYTDGNLLFCLCLTAHYLYIMWFFSHLLKSLRSGGRKLPLLLHVEILLTAGMVMCALYKGISFVLSLSISHRTLMRLSVLSAASIYVVALVISGGRPRFRNYFQIEEDGEVVLPEFFKKKESK